MPLDFEKLAASVLAFTNSLKNADVEKTKKIEIAGNVLQLVASNQEDIKKKIENSKTTWLVAGLVDNLALSNKAPLVPDDYMVVATDGSHIDIDRHQSARCFLINIGVVQLRYGDNSDAQLYSIPTLYYEDEDMVFVSENGKQVVLEGQLLGLKRTTEECRHLVDVSAQCDSSMPLLCLLDGSLIMWGILGQAYEEFIIEEFVTNGFLQSVSRLRDLSKKRELALASYISYPRSTEIVNVLRIASCPHDTANCDYYCANKYRDRDCDIVSGLTDRDIFNNLLNINERSAVFKSRSSIIDKYYGEQKVYFFYIKLDDEIARIEIPQWIIDKEGLVDLVHAMILDQCNKGLGYPVALSEAHEKAVITGVDRNQFWNLVEQFLIQDGNILLSSAKQKSKKSRWI